MSESETISENNDFVELPNHIQEWNVNENDEVFMTHPTVIETQNIYSNENPYYAKTTVISEVRRPQTMSGNRPNMYGKNMKNYNNN